MTNADATTPDRMTTSVVRWYERISRRSIGLVLLVVAIIFAPVVLLWRHIAFDPAKFTEIWVQSGVTSIVLFVVITLAMSARERHEEKERARRIVQKNVTRHFLSLHDVIIRTRGVVSDSLANRRTHEAWAALLTAMRDARSLILPDADVNSDVQQTLATFNIKEWETELNDFLAGKSDGSSLVAQLDAVVERLRTVGYHDD